MSLSQVTEIIRRLLAAGVAVHEWPNWQTRSNGASPAFQGGLIHHTASPLGNAYSALANGRGAPNPLSGPLCNFAGNSDGSLTVIAAGVANHAGASGRASKSLGPLPISASFNRYVLGLEIIYPGVSPMSDEQYRTAGIWARVVADVVGDGDIESVRAHAETSITGKWDPGFAPSKTIDMRAFRATASTILDYKRVERIEERDMETRYVQEEKGSAIYAISLWAGYCVKRHVGEMAEVTAFKSDGSKVGVMTKADLAKIPDYKA